MPAIDELLANIDWLRAPVRKLEDVVTADHVPAKRGTTDEYDPTIGESIYGGSRFIESIYDMSDVVEP